MFQAHLLYFLPQTWNQPLLQGIQIVFIRGIILETKIQALSVLPATELFLLLGRPADSERKYMCIY